MSLEQKKVFIAGSSGFPGVSLAHHLAERGLRSSSCPGMSREYQVPGNIDAGIRGRSETGRASWMGLMDWLT